MASNSGARTSPPTTTTTALPLPLPELQQSSRAEPDEIFYQIDQECKFIEQELASFASRPDSDPHNHHRAFPQRQIEALHHLHQFSPIFRNAYKELLSRLPLSISLHSRPANLGGVSMTSPVDLLSTQYVRTRCVFAADFAHHHHPPPPPSHHHHHFHNVSPQCETWTFKPYVIDTYLIGLSRILGAAADTRLERDELEEQLAAGYKQMCCSGHEDGLKELQAEAFAVRSRPVVERWREDVSLWWTVGKLSSTPTTKAGGGSSSLVRF